MNLLIHALYWNSVLFQRRRSDHACSRPAGVDFVLEFLTISAAPFLNTDCAEWSPPIHSEETVARTDVTVAVNCGSCGPPERQREREMMLLGALLGVAGLAEIVERPVFYTLNDENNTMCDTAHLHRAREP